MTTSGSGRHRRSDRPSDTNKYLEHLKAKEEASLKKYGSHLSLSKKQPPRGIFLGSSVLYDDNEGMEVHDPGKEGGNE